MCLSEGCPPKPARHTATVNNTRTFVYALSSPQGKRKTFRRTFAR